MNKTTILLSMFLFIGDLVYNQIPNIMFNKITYKEGLSGNWNYELYQDNKGFIWVGGYNGLQRYDGYEFKNYDQNIIVFDITEDNRGLLWVGTNEGIYLLNPENEQSLQYIPFPELLRGFVTYNRINKVLVTEDKIIWCASQNGLLKLEPKAENDMQIKEVLFKEGIDSAFNIALYQIHETSGSEGENRIIEIVEYEKGLLWIGSAEGIFVFNTVYGEFIRIDDDEYGKTRLNHQHVFAIVEENPDIFWARDLNGFTRISNIRQAFSNGFIDKTKLDFTSYTYILGGYPGFIVNQFMIDSYNNLWFGTRSNGLIKMSCDENKNVKYDEICAELRNSGSKLYDETTAVMEDRTGLMWACQENSGILTFREGNNLFIPMEGMLEKYNIRNHEFNRIYEDHDGNLWICSWGDGLFEINNEGHTRKYKIQDPAIIDTLGNYMYSIIEIQKNIFMIAAHGIWQFDATTGESRKLFKDSFDLEKSTLVLDLQKMDDNIYIRTQEQGFWIYNLKSDILTKYTANQNDPMGLIDDNVYSMDIMNNGDIWLSTRRQGLNRLKLDRSTGAYKFIELPEAVRSNDQIVNEKEIHQIYEDDTGIFWFCTQTGLIRLNMESGDMRKWTIKDGLSDNNVLSVEVDDKGNLWLATNHGLSMLDPETGIIKTFGETDGLPAVLHETIFSLKGSNGLMYFGGAGGFYKFDPGNLQMNHVVPPVVITEFRLFNIPVEVGKNKESILSEDISYTQEINLKYNQNDLSFRFAALDYNDPSKNRYAYILEGYQDEWVETGAGSRIATYTNLSPAEYVFRVKGSNNDGVWNNEGASINIIVHPPFWRTKWAYVAYVVIFLLLLQGYILLRTKRLRKEKIVLEQQVSERTRQIEQQKEELLQQKEELQTTLENLRKTQEQLVESEKMAAVGGLVAGVAHEINTPVGIGITAISNLLEDIQKMATLFEKNEINRKNFKEFLQSSHEVSKLIQKNLDRTASLVQSFKQVSADQVTEQQRVFNFREYLNDILLSLQPKFRGKHIDFKTKCDDELTLNSYPGVYAQIFTNLLINSLQHGFYNRDKGTITIEANIDKDLLTIRYTDDGEGISRKDLPHIFEPFYTSDQHLGTGLGLNIIYNLIRQKLHGTINCESEPGAGVLFTIVIPVE